MKMHIAKLYIPALMLLISFACSQETAIIPPPPPADEYVDAVIHLSSSSSSSPSPSPSTYALTEDGEKWIKEIDFLAFKVSDSGEYYDYRTRTTDIDEQKNEFTVSVKRSVNNERYRFVIIANASAAVSNANFTTLATKDQVYERIISDLPADGIWDATETNLGKPNKPIPMWGEAKPTVVTENLDLPTIDMLRALLRIDVVIKSAEIQKIFSLTDIYVYNTNRKGRVIPDTANLEPDGKVVKAVSLPADHSMTKGPIHYEPSSPVGYEREIYLYEADAVGKDDALQATCLIIGGKYNGSTEKSYYRVDFIDKSKSDLPFKPILRNHCYIINIANVLNEGHKTPDEAFVNIKTNMTVTIESWVMGGNDYNGNPYNFVINRNLFEGIGNDPYSGSFVLTTEEPGGWTSAASEGVDVRPASGADGADQLINFDVASNAPSPIFIEITSGPITKRITITR
jgi:hypothetical protein